MTGAILACVALYFRNIILIIVLINQVSNKFTFACDCALSNWRFLAASTCICNNFKLLVFQLASFRDNKMCTNRFLLLL